jgi:alpha-glucosidase
VAVGEARLVDYSRMKFGPLSGKANSLVSVLGSAVNSALPLTTPWRFIMAGNSPGQLLENNFLVLNLNDPCALTNTAWIQPGKVIRESTLTTTGGIACVDFAVKHRLQYIEFDAGWYGNENTTLTATNVNVDPARSPGPLDLPYVINYAATNGIGVILYVNWLAMTNELNLLPALYHSWGVKGIKYGFVGPSSAIGQQTPTTIVNEAARICATNQIMMDAHDEFRPSGYTRSYPNMMTIEGLLGDEGTPTTGNDTTELFSRMLVGGADHTMCYFDPRVTNSWSYAYQLAKAVCFYSPWQFIYWYDIPTNSYQYVSGAAEMITEVPELEFYDYMPAVWDETRVLQGSIGQYAVVARRSGTNWFIGAMNAGTIRTFNVPLDFLTPGQKYIANVYSQDASVPTRTQVRIDRLVVDSTSTLSMNLAASRGEAVRLTPAVPPVLQSFSFGASNGFSLIASGQLGSPYSVQYSTNLNLPTSNWTTLVGTSLISSNPFTNVDLTATNQPRRFYRFSTP